MWIYLRHILTLSIYDLFDLPSVWYIKYLIVYAAAIIMVIVINSTLDLVESKRPFEVFKYLRG